MNINLCIPPDHPALAGHFPGHPIVPAVVIIQAVASRLSEVTGVRIDDMRQLRLQQPLLPGQPVTMSCEPRGQDSWRVSLTAGETVIARGTFGRRSGPLPAPGAGPEGHRARHNGADAYRLLPHSGNMALINSFETDDTGTAYTPINAFTGHPLAKCGHLLPWVALEYAAQLYGCLSLSGVKGVSSAEPMDRAFIVMVRSLQVDARRQLDNGQDAELVLQVVSEQGSAAHCEFEAQVGGSVWGKGGFTVVSGY